MSHRPIFSIILDEFFKLGVVKISLLGLTPNSRNICLLNNPAKIMTIPMINQKGNIILSPVVVVLCGNGLAHRQGRGWSQNPESMGECPHLPALMPLQGPVHAVLARFLPFFNDFLLPDCESYTTSDSF